MIPVAGYCRVSTDSTDQANSFESQKRYFADYIRGKPDWQLYEIYADEGITGTSTKKRWAFNRMMNDAFEGKIRMIVTKEVSRFSRNILDTIAYTRQLRQLGVGVIFVTDRINTLEPESEMLLSYLATQSQEESRRTSQRVVWGQTRQMEQGVVFGRSLLGYRVKNGKLTVEPQGAETVRLIFHKYALEQSSAGRIARYLTEAGIRTGSGSGKWTGSGVVRLLRNEKYAGDLVQRKTYTPDYLTHEKKANRGQVPLVVLRNHHEPIVSRELWELAQLRLGQNRKHSPNRGASSSRYIFSGRIRCGQCGAAYICRYKYRKDGSRYRRWSCATAARQGTGGCGIGKLLRDDDCVNMLKTALRSLPVDPDAIAANVTRLVLEAVAAAGDSPKAKAQQLDRELQLLRRKKEVLLDSYLSGDIPREDMLAMNDRYDDRRQQLEQQMEKIRPDERSSCRSERELQGLIRSVLTGEGESEAFCKAMLERITVFPDRHLELKLQGLESVFCFTEPR